MNEVPMDPDWEPETPDPEPSAPVWRRWLGALRRVFNAPFRLIKPYVPRGLFPRSLVLIVAPIVLLQLAVTYIFFDRHYQLVTRLLSSSVAGDIAAALVLYDRDPKPATITSLHDAFFKTMSLDIRYEPDAHLPPALQRGPIDVLDGVIDKELAKQIHRPYWFNTHRRDNVDIRVQLPGGVMRVLVRRSRVLATNWHIFLVWMVLSSIIILTVAIGFLRIQVRTITRLAQAAEAFGRGRDLPDFRPAGAREVRAAARALIDMRNRLARHVDQRTDMLAGISHDMRTPLTRIRLQLELLPPSPDVDAMKADLAEIEHMLDEYLAFARGEGSEDVAPADMAALVEEIASDAERRGRKVEVVIDDGARQALAAVPVRRGALKRCLTNLLDNALTYGTTVRLSLRSGQRFFEIAVEDDGPGIAPENYEEAFRPFRRLDTGLRSGIPGSGLGLAISRDLARSHGGEIHLSKSALGGLKAAVRLPI
jgi:two-component system osmolarity sensor histidine kinase EnvZ